MNDEPGGDGDLTVVDGLEPAAQLRLGIDHLPAVIWTTDVELRITSMAGAGLEWLGLKPGTPVIELGPSVLDAHRRALEGERVAFEVTWGGRVLQASAEPFRDADSAIAGCLSVGLDITERKRAEEELRREQSGLEARVALRTAELEAANRALQTEIAERERAEERVHFLAQAGTVLASSLDWEETLRSIACLAVPTLADCCTVDIIDDGELRGVASCHADPDKDGVLDELLRRQPTRRDSPQLEAGVPLVVPEVNGEATARQVMGERGVSMFQALAVRSTMSMPLIARGQFMGVLGLSRTESGRRYGPEDVALAQDLAHRAALAIDNARLYRESDAALAEQIHARRQAETLAADIKARGDQQAVVAALGQCALAGASVSELMDDAVTYMAQALDVSQAAILELLPRDQVLRLAACVGACHSLAGSARLGPGAASHTGYALLSGGPVVVDDLSVEDRFPVSRQLLESGAVSGVSMPIQAGDRPLGVLAAYSPQPSRFGQDDVHFMQAVANLLGMALAGQQADQELKESQLRFKTLFEVLPVGVSLIDGQRHMVDANPALARILNLPHDRLMAGTYEQRRNIRLDGSPLPHNELPSVRVVQDGEATAGELGVVTEVGETIWVRVEAVPFPLPGQGVVIATSDITARIEAERAREAALDELEGANTQLAIHTAELSSQAEELRIQAEELAAKNAEIVLAAKAAETERRRYQELFDFAPDGYLVTDLNGIIREANQAARMLGVEPRLLVGKPLITFIDKADRPALHAAIERLREQRVESTQLELLLAPRNGPKLPVLARVAAGRDSQGFATSLRWLLHDVSDDKRLQEELQRARDELEIRVEERTRELAESEMRYRQMFESNWAIKWLVDPETGRIVAANPAACRYYGYSLDELTQMHVSDINMLPVEELADELRSAVAHEHYYFVFKHRLASGEIRDVEVYSSPVTAQGRTLLYSIIHDITDRVEAYQLLEQRVAERTRELATLLEIARRMVLTPELEPRLRMILDQLEEVVPYDSATVWAIDQEALVPLYHQGFIPQAEPPDLRLAVEQGSLSQQAIHSGRPIVIADVHADGAQARLFRRAIGSRFQALFGHTRTWMGLPLLVEDRPLGLLGLASAEVDGYGAREAELAAAFASQAALAIENERLIKQTRELAALEERQRLARDLHDAVSQTLFSAGLIAEVLPRVWERDRETGRQALQDLHQLTRGALAEMRTLLMELRPASLLDLDLDELLPQLGEAVTGRSRIPVTLDVQEAPALPPDVRINLYRIAQEALANVAKHSNATTSTVTLRGLPPAGVELRIVDDGVGFYPDTIAANSLGLDIMRERAAEIGAQLSIDSRPGQGTSVSARWQPKAP